MAEIRSHSVLDILELDGDTPMTRVTGDTSDISHLCEFSWYDHVWYIDKLDPLQNRKLARYSGPSHEIGQAMCSKILTAKGKEISRTSVLPLSLEDKNSIPVQQQINKFDQALKKVSGDRAAGLPANGIIDATPEFEP
jgi:hypothetical protein